MREHFIRINEQFVALLGARNCQLINVGSKADAGDGELVSDALQKVIDNLDILLAEKKKP